MNMKEVRMLVQQLKRSGIILVVSEECGSVEVPRIDEEYLLNIKSLSKNRAEAFIKQLEVADIWLVAKDKIGDVVFPEVNEEYLFDLLEEV